MVIPMAYQWIIGIVEDEKLYFHGAKQGHKIDLMSQCNKVSYTVFDKGHCKNDE